MSYTEETEIYLSFRGLKHDFCWVTGITSTIAYSTESIEVAVATVNFLLRDANCGLIARFNPTCLGQSSENWVFATLFYGSVPNILSQTIEGNLRKEIVIFRRQKLSEI